MLEGLSTTSEARISQANGTRIIRDGIALTDVRFNVLVVITTGTLTNCKGYRVGTETQINFLNDERFMWGTDIVAGEILSPGENVFITEITVGGGGRVDAS